MMEQKKKKPKWFRNLCHWNSFGDSVPMCDDFWQWAQNMSALCGWVLERKIYRLILKICAPFFVPRAHVCAAMCMCIPRAAIFFVTHEFFISLNLINAQRSSSRILNVRVLKSFDCCDCVWVCVCRHISKKRGRYTERGRGSERQSLNCFYYVCVLILSLSHHLHDIILIIFISKFVVSYDLLFVCSKCTRMVCPLHGQIHYVMLDAMWQSCFGFGWIENRLDTVQTRCRECNT